MCMKLFGSGTLAEYAHSPPAVRMTVNQHTVFSATCANFATHVLVDPEDLDNVFFISKTPLATMRRGTTVM